MKFPPRMCFHCCGACRKDCQFQICLWSGCPQDFHGEKPKLFSGLAVRCAESFLGPPALNFQACLRASSLRPDCADLSPSISSLFLSSPSLSPCKATATTTTTKEKKKKRKTQHLVQRGAGAPMSCVGSF